MNVSLPAVRPLASHRAAPTQSSPVRPLREPRLARLAAFRSPETDRLGRTIGFPVAVIAIVDDVERHAAMLSETWHACWRASDRGWFMPFDYDLASALSARFEPISFDGRWMGATAMPDAMTLGEDGSVAIELASGVSRSDLAQAFGQAMADRRFDAVAHRPSQVRKRFATGRKLEVPSRYAAPPAAGCDGRVTLVDDLYHFRPRALPTVIAALEASSRILSMCSALAAAAVPPR